jgi:hypothetical protein
MMNNFLLIILGISIAGREGAMELLEAMEMLE